MKSKFDYLKKYIVGPKHQGGLGINSFYPLTEKRVIDIEKKLDFRFPNQLRKFYLEIGSGFFYHNHNKSIIQKNHSNRLMPPEDVADIYLLREESEFVVYYYWENYHEEDLIFFEIGDGASFITLKPFSSSPNKVYIDGHFIIADSFDEFIWKLYYESPTYYLDPKYDDQVYDRDSD